MGALAFDPDPAVFGMVRQWRLGQFEPNTTSLFRKRVRAGMRIVDGGANYGLYSLLAASVMKGDGAVWAFEPNPRVFSVLIRNIALNGLEEIVEPHRLALGAGAGKATLHAHERFSGTGHLVREGTSPAADLESHAVEVTSLDGFLRGRRYPSIDLIKLDVEGFEPAALDGMTEVARRSDRLEVLLEVALRLLEGQGWNVEGLLDRLT